MKNLHCVSPDLVVNTSNYHIPIYTFRQKSYNKYGKMINKIIQELTISGN